MTAAREQYVFEFSGGELCLDFANTGGFRGDPEGDHLTDYDTFVSWSRQAGIVDATQAERLRRLAVERPDEAAAVHMRAVALREAIYRLFARLALDLPPAPEDLAVINAELGPALAMARLEPRDGGFAWGWQEGDDLARLLWPVARSAADTLAAETPSAVRECAAEDCNWLFVDTSKNRSRRWCDMKSCGNRAKARRHQARQKPPRGHA